MTENRMASDHHQDQEAAPARDPSDTYEPPTVVDLGSLAELTLGSGHGVMSDTFNNSPGGS